MDPFFELERHLFLSKWRVPVLLELYKRPQTVMELRENIELTKGYEYAIMVDLEEKNLIEKITGEGKRNTIYGLTQKGKDVLFFLKNRGHLEKNEEGNYILKKEEK